MTKISKKIQFKCVECKNDSSHIAKYENGTIEICHNHLQTKWQLTDILIHELIHAYDDCIDPMAISIDKKNINPEPYQEKIATVTSLPDHLSKSICSEIRASNLSDDCQWNKEILRGYFNPIDYYRNCIKRRTMKSLSNNEAINEKEFDRIYNLCINNRNPF